MGHLVSPGVSVPVTDQSFYIPQSASTVPLIFGATRANKLQPDGVSIADGTNEHGVVRTITSIGQSVKLYGVPYFYSDNSGTNNTTLQHHGDARNEYGLFALNQYLGIGSQAYFIRANIDLTDSPESFFAFDVPTVVPSSQQFVGVGTGAITGPLGSGLPVVPTIQKQPETFQIVCIGPQVGETVQSFTVTGTLSGMVGIARVGIPFGVSGGVVTNEAINFLIHEGYVPASGSTPASGYEFSIGDYFEFSTAYTATAGSGNIGNGVITGLASGASANAEENFTVLFTSATQFNVTGQHAVGSTTTFGNGTVNVTFQDSADHITFTIIPGSTPFAAGDTFTFSSQLIHAQDPLGVTDANKRQAIVAALQAEILSNQDIRSEAYEFNLILCPGYFEVATYLTGLSDTLNNEAFVIADTPVFMDPETTGNWANNSSSTNKYVARVHHTSLAYYYPWGYASNLDGTNITCAASGIALRTYAYSDNVSQVWFAPAGAQRGVVSNVSAVGYVSGTLGQATTFNQVNLNQGQRDFLYQELTAINPIVYFTGRGLLVWGQKTSSPKASARDRVNVERLLAYLRRAFRKAAFPFVFEINDSITQRNLKTMLDGKLSDVMMLRGLYDYVTVCNSTNNDPQRVDANELWADVGIKPTKVAEFVYVPITVYTTGANMGKN